jgi:four helix bundle protein
MAVHNFRKMEVWKNAMELTKSVYSILSEIPNDERFGLKSQISRCSVSVPSNIAEGSGRSTDKDFSHFLSISLGSCYELETQLILVQEIFNIDCEKIINDCQRVQKMIFGFKHNLIKN